MQAQSAHRTLHTLRSQLRYILYPLLYRIVHLCIFAPPVTSPCVFGNRNFPLDSVTIFYFCVAHRFTEVSFSFIYTLVAFSFPFGANGCLIASLTKKNYLGNRYIALSGDHSHPMQAINKPFIKCVLVSSHLMDSSSTFRWNVSAKQGIHPSNR